MAKKTVTITLVMSELIYDVQNKTFLTGRSRSTGDNPEEVAHMTANDDDENANQVLRSIGNAFFTMKTQLSEFIEEEGDAADNVMISPDEDLVVVLRLPSNYNPATRGTVAMALHQYIVCLAVADWFTITNKADAADYVTLAAANMNVVRDAINRRVRPVRPSVEP